MAKKKIVKKEKEPISGGMIAFGVVLLGVLFYLLKRTEKKVDDAADAAKKIIKDAADDVNKFLNDVQKFIKSSGQYWRDVGSFLVGAFETQLSKKGYIEMVVTIFPDYVKLTVGSQDISGVPLQITNSLIKNKEFGSPGSGSEPTMDLLEFSIDQKLLGQSHNGIIMKDLAALVYGAREFFEIKWGRIEQLSYPIKMTIQGQNGGNVEAAYAAMLAFGTLARTDIKYELSNIHFYLLDKNTDRLKWVDFASKIKYSPRN